MERKPNESKSKLNIRTISSDIVVQTVNNNKSNKNIKKCPNSLQNFISIKKKLKFKSAFDCKGAKIFLAEKSKAMEILVLDDEIIPERQNKKTISQSYKKKKNHSKDDVIPIKLNNLKNKKMEKKKYKTTTKIVSDFFINNITDIGKIIQNKNKKTKKRISSIKNNYYINSNANDSSIYSIIKQMSNIKN